MSTRSSLKIKHDMHMLIFCFRPLGAVWARKTFTEWVNKGKPTRKVLKPLYLREAYKINQLITEKIGGYGALLLPVPFAYFVLHCDVDLYPSSVHFVVCAVIRNMTRYRCHLITYLYAAVCRAGGDDVTDSDDNCVTYASGDDDQEVCVCINDSLHYRYAFKILNKCIINQPAIAFFTTTTYPRIHTHASSSLVTMTEAAL